MGVRSLGSKVLAVPVPGSQHVNLKAFANGFRTAPSTAAGTLRTMHTLEDGSRFPRVPAYEWLLKLLSRRILVTELVLSQEPYE